NMKIKALLRRAYDFKEKNDEISFKSLVLNKDKLILTYKGKDLGLSKNEFLIMEILMENEGSVIKREKIMDKLWATDSFIDDNTLTVNINRLRQKLKTIGIKDLIKTKKGMGYYLNEEF